MHNREELLATLAGYNPYNEVEQQHVVNFINFIQNNDDCFERSNEAGHVTTTAWIVDFDAGKALMMKHAKLKLLLPAGGHCDGDSDVLHVVMKEAEEETGAKPEQLSQVGDILDVDIHTIPEHKGIPEHLHYNVSVLFEAKVADIEILENHESEGVEWVAVEGLPIRNIGGAMHRCKEQIIELMDKRKEHEGFDLTD